MRSAEIVLTMLAVLILCGMVQAWTTPQPVTNGINTSSHENFPFLSFDGRTLYFTRETLGHWEIYQATRTGTSGPFTSVTKALAHGSDYHVSGAWVSADNLRLYYRSESSLWRLRVSTRASVAAPWPAGIVIPGLESFNKAGTPKLTQDELTIVFDAYNAPGGMGSWDIWIASRPDTSSPFGNIRNLSEINSSTGEGPPYLTPDGLALYFYSTRNGTSQLFRATRDSLSEPFDNLEHLSFFDSAYGVGSPSLSADGLTLFFSKASADGTSDIYFSERSAPVACIAGGSQTLEAQGPSGANVTLDGSCSSDADSTPGTNDDINDFNWYRVDPCDPDTEISLGHGETIDCGLPLGQHTIFLEVTDKDGASDVNQTTVTIQDTTPPDFEFSVSPVVLWPANRKLVIITPSCTASDICDSTLDVYMADITTNDETVTEDDIQMDADGFIYLRAERSRTTPVRIYTITYNACDDYENCNVQSATVTVTHSRKK